MRTLDAFNLKPARLTKPDRKCIAPGCGKALKGGQKKFCSDKCRWGTDANARKAVERVSHLLSRREFMKLSLESALALNLHLESRPESGGERRSHNASVLHDLDVLLARRGPNDAAVRSFVCVQADAIRLAFEADTSWHPDDWRHYVHALEILRDVGSEDPDDRETLLQYARAAATFHLERKDYLSLARSLQALANICRLNRDETEAKRLTHYAWHVLNDKFSRSNDPEVLTIVHQSAFWDLRLYGEHIGRDAAERKRRQIIELAETVNTPTIWIETHRELAGHYGRDRWYEDDARKELLELAKRRKEIPHLTTYGAPTLLRPEIELLLGSDRDGERDEAIHLSSTDYLALYNRDPNVYYYRQLKKWDLKYRLSLQLSAPTYASALLPYLPRGTLGA